MIGLRGVLFVVLLVQLGVGATVTETCSGDDVKLHRTELDAPSRLEHIYYLNDETGDDENYVLILSDHGALYNSTDGGVSFELQNPMMAGSNEVAAPGYVAGAREVRFSRDGSQVWALASKPGYWRKPRTSSWVWQGTGTDFVFDLYPHPTSALEVLGLFKSQGCYNSSSSDFCKSILRYSNDAGATWNDVHKQCIQVAWSTVDSKAFYFSGHYDESKSFYDQSWYQSKLFKGSTTTLSQRTELLDHQAGLAYRNGTLIAAQRVAETGAAVYLYSSTDEAATPMVRAVFRGFTDNEIEAQSFNILDLTAGSIFINVRTDSNDRGDVYSSAALDHDFTLVLSDNVRGGALGDFTRLASLRGIYAANVFYTNDQVMTGISFDMGANWDFVQVPPELRGRCNYTAEQWCGLHFLGRSNSGIGQGPYSAQGAIGIAIATGIVGPHLDVSSTDDLSTFITRDGGVTWKEVDRGDNVYAMADRGAVILWASRNRPDDSISWSWNEGKTSLSCSFNSLGTQIVQVVSSSPSKDGLRFHLLTETTSGSHYVITVDFSSLGSNKCQGASNPDAPDSNYEKWTPRDPDGEQGCLLGTKTTYVRRKQNFKCFNADNDLALSSENCKCERDDYECDDCFEVERFWEKNSKCIPKRSGTCAPAPNPCAGGATSYFETRGYRKIPFDSCISDSSDTWAPVSKSCVNGNTQPPSTTSGSSSTGTTGTSSSSSLTTSSSSSKSTGTFPSSSTSSSTSSTQTTAPGDGGPSRTVIVAASIITILIVGAIVGFLIARRNPAFQRRFGGRLPFVSAPEEPYSTLGELETGRSTFDDDDF